MDFSAIVRYIRLMNGKPPIRFLQWACFGLVAPLAFAGCLNALNGVNALGTVVRLQVAGPAFAASKTPPETIPANTLNKPQLNELQQRIIDAALHIVGRRDLKFDDRQFSWDCSGVILSVYYLAGMDLSGGFERFTGNGVKRLHRIGEDNGLLYHTLTPVPGDLVFWDNTYDRSANGQWGDPLTHAGVVISVSDDGTISFIHHNYRRGIIVETMNLLRPDQHLEQSGRTTRVVNAPMRMQRDRAIRPDAWLASHLHRGFAQLHLLEARGGLAAAIE